MLGNATEDARVLDLYCGSGSFGLEALSRGAASCVFVDRDRAAADAVGATLRKAGLTGATLVTAPVESWLNRPHADPFHLIFADPPYARNANDTNHAQRLLESGSLIRLLAPDGVLILETSSGRSAPPLTARGWDITVDRTYGDARITFLRPSAAR